MTQNKKVSCRDERDSDEFGQGKLFLHDHRRSFKQIAEQPKNNSSWLAWKARTTDDEISNIIISLIKLRPCFFCSDCVKDAVQDCHACTALALISDVGYVCKIFPKGEAAMEGAKGQGKGKSGNQSASENQKTLVSLQCQVHNAEYQEVAAALLDYHKETLEEKALESLEQIVRAKPKFGYWTISDAEYDQEYSLAMDLGRLQVFKGNVSADRDEYRLARRLNCDHPTLVGLNRFDYRRQFVVFLSSKAWALRRFALIEMARHHSQFCTILFG